MNSGKKMNVFLQRMLRRSDEELNTEVADKEAENNDVSKSGSPRGSWIKKLGNCSPRKYKVPSTPLNTNRMKDLDGTLSSAFEATTPRKSPVTSGSPLEMPDLESIIREFEMGFLSPTKHEVTTDATKQKNFVKKIVAAFEVKYKAYNDSKSEEELKQFEEDKLERGRSPRRFSSVESPRRRSGLFGSPRKNHDSKGAENKSVYAGSPSRCTPDSSSRKEGRSGIFSSPLRNQDSQTAEMKTCARSPSKCTPDDSSKKERRSGIFSSPKKSQDEDSKPSRRSGIFSSPFVVGRSTSKDPNRRSGIYVSPVNPDRQDTTDSDSISDNTSLFKFDKEESICGNPISSSFLNPFRTISLDDNKSVSSIDLDVTLPEPEETILIDDVLEDLTTDDFSMSRCETPERTNTLDRTPKIVGAFLKKPIEVEDTSIDWIPIIGKKLPRKKSLKKLLSVLTGKISFEKKSNVLFASEKNLTEESRELQDSGYDEKSCSSSSLTSLISITEMLLHQENSYVEPERRSTLKTFRSRNSLQRENDEEEDEAFCDAYSTGRRGKRLVLTEVPREALKLDLGPSFPTSTKILTMSLDRRALSKQKTRTPSPKYVQMNRIPKHPFLSKIRKHPFVSMTKMDEYQEPNESLERSPMIIQNDLYKVEFRRSCEDIVGTRLSCGSTSDESNYDVPRRFLSKSENSIPGVCDVSVKSIENEHVYDVPKSKFMARPRSSVYEDALSLKRRTAQLPSTSPPDFYAFANDSEPHYATVKPRNRRVYLSEDMLRSNGDPYAMKKSTSF